MLLDDLVARKPEENAAFTDHRIASAQRAARRVGLNLTEDDAIRWITINPAWALGIHNQTGSLEVGKNADLVLWTGNPFSVYSRAERVWIDGALMYDRTDPRSHWRTDFELGYIRTPGGSR